MPGEKTALVLLAEGFEEVEAVTPIDYLRRAGATVTVAAVGGNSLYVNGARGITVSADIFLEEAMESDILPSALVIPGGLPGADNIAASVEARALIAKMQGAGKKVCAICASPAIVLAPLGILAGKKFTCYPGMEKGIADGHWSDDPVVIDGNIITSRGAGTAGLFSLAIIAALFGEEKAREIAQSVLIVFGGDIPRP